MPGSGAIMSVLMVEADRVYERNMEARPKADDSRTIKRSRDESLTQETRGFMSGEARVDCILCYR